MATVQVTVASAGGPASWKSLASDLHRYRDLSEKIRHLEQHKPTEKVAAARHTLQQLYGELAKRRAPLTSMAAVVEQEERELDNMYYPGKLLGLEKPIPIVGFFSELKMDEHEKNLEEMRKKRDEQMQVIEATELKLAEAEKVAAKWQTKAKALRAAQEERDLLLERIMAASEWAEAPGIVALQGELRVLQELAMQVDQDTSLYIQAKKKMQDAISVLLKARQALNLYKMEERIDVVKQGNHSSKLETIKTYVPGTELVDAVRLSDVQNANGLIKDAAQRISEVLNALLPGMRGVEEALLRKAAAAGLILEESHDSMVQVAKIHGGLKELDTLEAQARQGLGWVKAGLERQEDEVRRLRVAAHSKEEEMQAYKRAQVEQAAVGRDTIPA